LPFCRGRARRCDRAGILKFAQLNVERRDLGDRDLVAQDGRVFLQPFDRAPHGDNVILQEALVAGIVHPYRVIPQPQVALRHSNAQDVAGVFAQQALTLLHLHHLTDIAHGLADVFFIVAEEVVVGNGDGLGLLRIQVLLRGQLNNRLHRDHLADSNSLRASDDRNPRRFDRHGDSVHLAAYANRDDVIVASVGGSRRTGQKQTGEDGGANQTKHCGVPFYVDID
jgi:hypothetical protein